MSNKLLIDERPLTVLPSLVTLVGMERAVILQQIHWMLQQRNSGVMLDGHKWVWGTHEEWCEEYFPFWKPDTLRKHLNRLVKDGYIITMQPKGFDRTNHYRVNYEQLELPMRHDHAGSKRHKHPASMRHDDAETSRHDDTGSKRNADAASKGHDDAASYKEKTSTETSTETSQKRDVGVPPTPPAHHDAWPDFLVALCWICHGHRDLKALTESQRGALTAEARKLYDARYTTADLRRWMEGYWFRDWRWKKDRQRPRPDMVRSMIPELREDALDVFDICGAYADDDDGDGGEEMAIVPEVQTEEKPTPPSEPWSTCLKELELALPDATFSWLEGSDLVEAGTVPNGSSGPMPLYQVLVRRAYAVDWLSIKMTGLIERSLGSMLGRRVRVEIVAAEKEPT